MANNSKPGRQQGPRPEGRIAQQGPRQGRPAVQGKFQENRQGGQRGQGKSFNPASKQAGKWQDKPQRDATKKPFKPTARLNADQGFEEATRSNRQYDRRPGSQPAISRQGGRKLWQSPRQDQGGFKGSPAALRFGPGSKPAFKHSRPQPAAPRMEPQLTAPSPELVEEDLPQVNLLTGRNPIREAIKTGRDLEKLMIAKGELSGSAREIVSLAKKAGIMIQSVERSRLDQLAKNHQGMIAFASAYQYATVEDILQAAQNRGEDPFIIILDQVTDPHNLGAVIRTAACAGAHGVIVPLHRAVGLTPAAVKASAGAVEHIKVARVTNLSQTIKALQKQKIWFYAAQMEGEDFRSVSFEGPCALVIGSEGEGVSKLIAETVDKQVRIPMQGEMNSLNASVAAAILMYAVYGARNPLS